MILTFFERSSSLGAADSPGVHEVDLERVLLEQLEEAVALEVVRHREERVRPRHAEELAGLVRAARARPLRLAEHEEGRCLRPLELGDCRDDVLVPVQDQQEVGLLDLVVDGRLDHAEREGRAPVLRVARVVEVDVVAVLRDVLEVRVGLRDRAVDRRLVVGVEPEGLREAAVLGRHDPAVGHPARRSRPAPGASRSGA